MIRRRASEPRPVSDEVLRELNAVATRLVDVSARLAERVEAISNRRG